MSSNNSFKNKLTHKLFGYKQDLTLNNPQVLIWYKMPTKQLLQ